VEVFFKEVLKFMEISHIENESPACIIIDLFFLIPPNVNTHEFKIIPPSEIVMTFIESGHH